MVAKIYTIESPALEMGRILKNKLSAVSVNHIRDCHEKPARPHPLMALTLCCSKNMELEVATTTNKCTSGAKPKPQMNYY